LHLPD